MTTLEGSLPRAIFIASSTFHNARQILIVLCATSSPCFFSSATRHSDICSNVMESGATSPHMSRILRHAGHQILFRVPTPFFFHSSVTIYL